MLAFSGFLKQKWLKQNFSENRIIEGFNKMELLQEYALVAEIISAIAVVVSLIYVGYQLHLNTAENRIASIHSITSGFRDHAMNYVHNEALSITWQKILTGQDLTEREVFIFSNNLYSVLMLVEEAYYRNKAGLLTDEFLMAKVKLMEFKILASPKIRKQHGIMVEEEIYTPEFAQWLDSKLQESDLYHSELGRMAPENQADYDF